MHCRAPASAANLGPGFDVLALALSLYIEVEVVPAGRLSVSAEGEGSDLALDGSHLAARVAKDVLGHSDVAIKVRSEIPVQRGLGSSAALALATAAAAGAEDPLAVAARYDGHPENAAASLLGGLVAAQVVEGTPLARRLPLDEALSFVVVIPDRQLPTKEARSVLPESVLIGDAVYNLGRMGLLLAGLADHAALVGEAGGDRLHQDARQALFPEAPLLLGAMREAGATVACWSGAGPSLLGICSGHESAVAVRAAGDEALASAGLAGESLVLEPDLGGLLTW
ncbi:MAG: homoserine kinase [Acidimicrobiales bacterium]